MKRVLSVVLLLSLLIGQNFYAKKSHAIVGATLVGTGNVIAGGVLLAVGGAALVSGLTVGLGSFEFSKIQREICQGWGCVATAGIGGAVVLVGLIALPTNDIGVEFNEVEDDIDGLSQDDVDTYNFWALPLTLRSRAIHSQLENTPNIQAQNEDQKVNIASGLWKNEMDDMGIDKDQQDAIKRVFAAHIRR